MSQIDTAQNAYAGVYILDATYQFDKAYDYYIDEKTQGKITRGNYIIVPFGGGNKRRLGIVWELKDFTEAERTKPVDKVVEVPALNIEQLELAAFLKENTFCTIGEALKVIAPTGIKSGLSIKYLINTEKYLADDLFNNTNDKMRVVLNRLSEKNATSEALREEFGENITGVLNTLVKKGYLSEEITPERITKEKTVKYASIDEEKYEQYMASPPKPLTGTQYKVTEFLTENGDFPLGEMLEELSVGISVVYTLEKKGLVEIYEKEVFRDFADEYTEAVPGGEGLLSESQRVAFEKLLELYKNARPCAALLHGVTGSGKTHVLKALIDQVIAEGRQVIMLVPEIALTPQNIAYFKNYYKEKVKVLHSSLSAGEKFDTWRRVKSGEINFVIGTRSAIFAPFAQLGLVIIDEEQEHTYKSDKKPYYHAKEVARFRCAKHGAMMVLSSATPSIESYYKADTGAYSLVKLEDRYNEAPLPKIFTVDMREESAKNRLIFISETLKGEIEKNLANKEQTIIFQNRRGYYNFLSCRSCGESVMCPNCSISLKAHAKDKIAGENENKNRREPVKLICHYCGYSSNIPELCPQCKSDKLVMFGSGTQKCEDDLAQMFPEAKIARLDSDTASTKHSHTRILNSVKNEEVDILVGTQMITKGHNFKNVTLAGILFAEQGLFLDDYRSNERMFEMIVQVAGRAGRYEKNGRGIIQTYKPESEIIEFALKQDYELFYKKEIRFRKASVFPPFCDICVINIISEFENEAVSTAKKIGEMLKDYMAGDYSEVKAVVFGAFPASIYRLNRNFRMKYVIKCKLNKKTKEMLSLVLTNMQKQATKKVTVTIDTNPNMI
ncbi:MAG: primosomal protein N' [Oscillospiraceae bacterium]|nr:primosomal protein N' [Oscillospiraceae bacterium]